MRLLRVAGLIVIVPLSLILLAAIWYLARPDLLVNPLSRQIMSQSAGWGTPVPLMPEPFLGLTRRETVESSLTNAGFEPADATTAWRYGGELALGKTVYVREADRFPCQRKFYVVLAFDAADILTEAIGYEHEHGCL